MSVSKISRSRAPVVSTVLLRNRHEITVDDLALMLEIDLSLGCKQEFRDRLQRALNSVARTAGTA